jgi:MFS family permease
MAFTLASSGVLTVYLTQRLSPRTVKIYGAFGLLTGAAVSVLSLALHSPTVFLIGTAIAGSGFGGGFQGAVRSVIPLAHADERAGVLSVIFIVSYLAMGLPAIAAGLFVARWGDLTLTAQIFGGVVAGLAVLALLGEVSGRKEIASSVPKLA